MGYYRGDYYRGDGNYYRGDPFLGGLISGAAKFAAPLIGKAANWVGKATGLVARNPVAAAATAVGATAPILRAPAASMPAPIQLGPIGINPGAALPGGQPLITWGVKKRRRMNPLNPKALKRAIRRAEGFEKFARKTVNALYTTRGGVRRKTFKKTRRSS